MKEKLLCKKNIIAYILFIIAILFALGEINFSNAAYISEDINEIDESQYPGYKSLIQSLISQYPSWEFKLYYTELDWEDVITNECQGHGASPKNLSPANNSNYDGEWICPYCGRTTYDSGSWYCASESAIRYMMDPRNSINSSDIFQFQNLSSSNIVRENVEKMVSGTFLDEQDCVDAIITASQTHNVNGYYLVARILQEQGINGSYLSLGEGYKGNYVGVYNLFNIGAYGSGKDNVINNGLAYAESMEWHSKAESILGGTEFVAKSYIAIGQNTLYFQKFNVVTSNLYNHQYMQNILAAQNEGTKLRKTYAEMDNNFSSTYSFLIPVYENMPKDASLRPSTITNSTEDVLEAVVNAKGGLKLRTVPGTSTSAIASVPEGSTVKIILRATEKIDGYYWDKVLTSKGYYGYVARESSDGSKVYLVVEGEEVTLAKDNIEIVGTNVKCSPKVDFNALKEIYEKVEYDGEKLATGKVIKINDTSYTLVVKGDVNGDGEVNIIDVFYILDHLDGQLDLEQECFKDASKVTGNTEITIFDFLTLLDYLDGKVENI